MCPLPPPTLSVANVMKLGTWEVTVKHGLHCAREEEEEGVSFDPSPGSTPAFYSPS